MVQNSPAPGHAPQLLGANAGCGLNAGAGVMSAVWPGAGTVIGYNAADLAMNFVIVNPLVDSYFGGLPPPAAMDAAVLTGDAPLPRPTFQRADERALQGMGSVHKHSTVKLGC